MHIVPTQNLAQLIAFPANLKKKKTTRTEWFHNCGMCLWALIQYQGASTLRNIHFDFYMFASLISGSILINSKMLVVILKKPPLKEKKISDNSRMATFKVHLGSRLAGGLAQTFALPQC